MIKKGVFMLRKKWLFMLSLVLIIGVLAACGDDNNEDKANDEQAEMPEPDLEGIPDIVADVNDGEVTKEDFEATYQQQFQQMAMQAQMYGQNMDEIDQDELKEQTADGLVGQELLMQEANDRVSDISDDDIEETIDQVVEQNGMESKDELLDALKEQQDMDEDEFMEQIETQVRVDKLLEEESGDLDPTEDEVKEAYEDMKKQQEEADSDEDVPEFDEMEDQLKEQLKQQNQQEVTEDLVAKLREDADVKIHL